MKKRYNRLKIKFSAIVLAVLILGCGILTYQKAQWIISDYRDIIYEEYIPDNEIRYDFKNGREIIPAFYLGYDNMLPHISDDIGFYSELKNFDDETLAYYQPYIVVHKRIGYADASSDRRVLLLGDDFAEEYDIGYYANENDEDYHKSEAFHALTKYSSFYTYSWDETGVKGLEITGTCDENFIYLEKLKWYGHDEQEVYEYVPRKTQTEKGTMSVEDWLGNLNESNHWITMKNLYYVDYDNAKYNREAKELCEKVADSYISGEDRNEAHIDHEGLFTYYIQAIGYINEDYFFPCVYVFHPLNIAVKELTYTYLAVLVFAALAMALIWFLIERAYKQQLEHENNRRGLTRGIAHELKTPLAITRGYVENWEYISDADRKETAETMIDEIDHMNKMVMDLLELSRLEAKSKGLNIEQVELRSLTESVLKKLDPFIKERQLKVTLLPETEEEFVVEADLEMMRTVLMNFISNAVKYADKEISVTLTSNNKKVEFSIENDGTEISADKINKVWDEFYKADAADRTEIGSSGLGLAITKNILVLHGAKYGCKSENGKTVFRFEVKRNR